MTPNQIAYRIRKLREIMKRFPGIGGRHVPAFIAFRNKLNKEVMAEIAPAAVKRLLVITQWDDFKKHCCAEGRKHLPWRSTSDGWSVRAVFASGQWWVRVGCKLMPLDLALFYWSPAVTAWRGGVYRAGTYEEMVNLESRAITPPRRSRAKR